MGSDSGKCVLCKSQVDDPLNLGELKKIGAVKAHYYCLLLSSTITQSGEDNDGILGFLASDIVAEVNRARKRVCVYCKNTGATVTCSAKCNSSFHLPCGLSHGSGHQFHGSFQSTCAEHRPKQKFKPPKEPQECPICYEEIDFSNWMQVLRAPCCKNAYFHRKCVQQLALSAGYFFKCPMCNNKSTFLRIMRHYGVFVPDRDASWEMVPDAYGELLERHDECNVSECLYPHGRKESREHGVWSLVLCNSCGSQGTHLRCSNLNRGDTWSCSVCKSTEQSQESATTSSEDNTTTTSRVTTSSGDVITVRTTTFDPQPSTSNGLLSITNIDISSTNMVKINLVTKHVRKRKRSTRSNGLRPITRSRADSNTSSPDREGSQSPFEALDIETQNNNLENNEIDPLLNNENSEQLFENVKETRSKKRKKLWQENSKNEEPAFTNHSKESIFLNENTDTNFNMNIQGYSLADLDTNFEDSDNSLLIPSEFETYDATSPDLNENTYLEPQLSETNCCEIETVEINSDTDACSEGPVEMESYDVGTLEPIVNDDSQYLSEDDDVIFVKRCHFGDCCMGTQTDDATFSDDEVIVID